MPSNITSDRKLEEGLQNDFLNIDKNKQEDITGTFAQKQDGSKYYSQKQDGQLGNETSPGKKTFSDFER